MEEVSDRRLSDPGKGLGHRGGQKSRPLFEFEEVR